MADHSIFVQFTETEFKGFLKSCIQEGIRESGLPLNSVNPGKLLSIPEAASFLNLAPQTLYGFTSNRTIPFIKKGKKLYFRPSDLEQWLTDGRKATAKELERGFPGKIKGGKP